MSVGGKPSGAYPALFRGILQSGRGLILLEDTPWTGLSIRTRWYAYLKALRGEADPLAAAMARGPWEVRITDAAVTIRRKERAVPPGPDVTKVLAIVLDKPPGVP